MSLSQIFNRNQTKCFMHEDVQPSGGSAELAQAERDTCETQESYL